MKNFALYFFLLIPVITHAQQINPLWVSTEETDGDLGMGRLPIVLVDSSHDVIVCGSTYAPGPVLGFVTTKYDSDGNQLWQRRYDTFATDLITSAATDDSSAVYVGGSSINPFSGQAQFIVIKYSSGGDTLWQYAYGSIPGAATYLSKVLVDSSQNLLIFGSYVNPGANEFGLLAVKLDPDGNEIWNATYEEGNYGYGGLGAEWMGNHIVFWAQNGSPEGLRFFAWQIDTDGQTIKTAQTEPYSDYFESGYFIDQAGNLYIGDQAGEYKVSKFTLDGIKAWEYKKELTVLNPNGVSARLRCISTDSVGGVFISGMFYLNDSIGLVGITSKLNSSGNLFWEHTLKFGGFKTTAPYRSKWISKDLFLVTGPIVSSLDSNFYEYFLATYDQNGFVKGGISDIAGRRNWPASIAPDGAYFYIAGKADPETEVIDPSWQFLCKYSLDEVVSTSTPFGGVSAPGQLLLYPNPVQNKCLVSLDHISESTQGILEATDIQGNTMFRKKVPLPAGMNDFELIIPESLPAGVYGITLHTAKKTYAGRFVKVK